MMRDCRINQIFEGSSEVMHLFMAREAVDKHLKVAGAMIDPKKSRKEKLAALPKVMLFYAGWYPRLWLKGLTTPFRYGDFGRLATHLRFIERSSRKLARESFHGMMVYQSKMERKQGFLFRCVDVVIELYAMAAAVSHARGLPEEHKARAEKAEELADLFCRNSRRKVGRLFQDLWSNEDSRKNRVAASVLQGDDQWLTEEIMDLGFGPEAFQTRFVVASGQAPGDGRSETAAEGPVLKRLAR
jgi:hypothetical protein